MVKDTEQTKLLQCVTAMRPRVEPLNEMLQPVKVNTVKKYNDKWPVEVQPSTKLKTCIFERTQHFKVLNNV